VHYSRGKVPTAGAAVLSRLVKLPALLSCSFQKKTKKKKKKKILPAACSLVPTPFVSLHFSIIKPELTTF
jgi:hypothetical protein